MGAEGGGRGTVYRQYSTNQCTTISVVHVFPQQQSTPLMWCVMGHRLFNLLPKNNSNEDLKLIEYFI